MQAESLKNIVRDIQRMKSETQNIELKAAAKGCPTRLFDTLSSFSNQDEGGIILFGIDEERGYAVNGVYDPQDLQKKVTEQCKQMQPPVRALFTACEIDGVTVVSAEIPGVDIADRPVFYKGVGRIKGSYVRVGESDEPMSEYEVYSYDAFRKRVRDDIRVVENTKFSLVDEIRMAQYLHAVRNEQKNLAENVSIRIEMYRDRMEILSSGGLYGKITIDALGKVRPETRNAALANILELLHITENRYSGIPTMQSVLMGSEYPVVDTLLFYVENGETPEMSLLTRSRRHSSLTLCSVSRAMYCFVMPQSRPIRSRLLISTTSTFPARTASITSCSAGRSRVIPEPCSAAAPTMVYPACSA